MGSKIRGDGAGRSTGGAAEGAEPVASGARSRTAWLLALGAVVTFAVFVADLLTGAEISFSFIYLFPVAIAAWFVGRWAGLLAALLSAVGWVAAYLLNGRFYSQPSILYWNVAVELATFCTVALALSSVRVGVERRRALTRRLEHAYGLLDREQREVGEIQRGLLPAGPPEVPGCAIVTHYATSTRAGGDYYDFFPLPDGRVGILVADAAGHGTPAAVVMAMTRALIHTAAETLAAPERALATLNARLFGNLPPGSFTTACYATLEPGSGRLEYASGGHNPPLIVRAGDGAVEELTTPDGLPLGIRSDAGFPARCASLHSGDTLVLYTDGITEAMDTGGGFFGEERLRRVLAESRHAPPEAIRDRLVAALEAHAAGRPAADDVTLVIVRFR
jgi:serine phosphatase RsbU (regulator of sigma subunit)